MIDIQTGKVFDVSILQENVSVSLHNIGKITAFQQITNNLHKINDTEPLPVEFDEILSQGIH